MTTAKARTLRIDGYCNHCGSHHILVVNEEDFCDWLCGDATVQDAFPYLSGNERELLLSHTCGKCWDKMMETLFEDEEEDGFTTDWDSDFDEPDLWEALM